MTKKELYEKVIALEEENARLKEENYSLRNKPTVTPITMSPNWNWWEDSKAHVVEC